MRKYLLTGLIASAACVLASPNAAQAQDGMSQLSGRDRIDRHPYVEYLSSFGCLSRNDSVSHRSPVEQQVLVYNKYWNNPDTEFVLQYNRKHTRSYFYLDVF